METGQTKIHTSEIKKMKFTQDQSPALPVTFYQLHRSCETFVFMYTSAFIQIIWLTAGSHSSSFCTRYQLFDLPTDIRSTVSPGYSFILQCTVHVKKFCPTFTGLSEYLVCAFAECMHLNLISIISSMLIACCRNRMPKSLEVTVVAAYYYSYYAVCKINSMFSVTGGKQHWRRPLRYWLGMIARFAADWIMRLDVNQKCSRIPEFQMP